MRTRDKKRIVKLFLDGWSVERIWLWGGDKQPVTKTEVEAIIREAMIAKEMRR